MTDQRTIDTLIHARWIVPVEPHEVVLENHAIAISEGKILSILPSNEATAQYRATTVHHLDGHALLPGLINVHTHSPMVLLRGLADDLPLHEWLQEHIWPAEQQWVSPEFVRDGTRHAMAEMIRSGTTCFTDMYFFPNEIAKAALEIGMRVCVGLIVIDFPTAWANNAEEYFSKGQEVHRQFQGEPLIHTALAPHAPYTVADASLERIAMLAEELDIPVTIHVHETAKEVNDAVVANGERPLKRLLRLGLLSPHLLAVHMTQLEDKEIAQLYQKGVHVSHCPESNLKLASGFCPVQALVKAGVNVAIGTDGAASNNDLDMLAEMRLAALLAKAVGDNASAIPAATALRMATLNGAKALGLDSITGSLVPGKAADMIAINLQALESQPLYHPISQLVYATGRHQVTDVWVAGRQLMKERRLLTVDEGEVMAKSGEWRDKFL